MFQLYRSVTYKVSKRKRKRAIEIEWKIAVLNSNRIFQNVIGKPTNWKALVETFI